MVLDGNSIINRAYYGVRPLTTRDGFFTHAIFGFLTMLGRLLDEEKPEALCVAFGTAGTGGFGYDPIFYYPPFGKTLAEVTPEEKNQVSHRAVALRAFYDKLKEEGYADK